jgi:hypothetical protein
MEQKTNVVITPPASDMNSMDTLNSYIDREIAIRMQRQSWKHMDVCFKWKLVQEYIKSLHMPCSHDILNEIRALIKTNGLANVEYDGVRVLRLNVHDI